MLLFTHIQFLYSTQDNKKIISCINDFESWDETVERLSEHISEISLESINIINTTIDTYKDFEYISLVSTGKDSMVMLDLVQKVIPDVRIIFNNTSLDTAETYKIVKSHKDWEITNPKEGFYQYCNRMNYTPSMINRGCCTIFKEGNSINYLNDVEKSIQFMGIKKSDSRKRKDRGYINHNPKWRKRQWYSCYPLLNWTDFDVWLYIFQNNILIHPKYKQGYDRVGCHIACPYQTKYKWVLDDYWYKETRQRWLKLVERIFIDTNTWIKTNCTVSEYVNYAWNRSLYRDKPTDEVVEEFMRYKGLTDKNIAINYFRKKCCECGKNIGDPNCIAMNMKFLGRNIDDFYCKNHLAKKIDIDIEKWDDYIKEFKEQGCSLF